MDINAAASLIESNPWQARAAMKPGLLSLPDNAAAWYNYGIAHHLCGNIDAAIKSYQVALAYGEAPREAIANNLSQDLLLSGQYKEGWQWYEKRPAAKHHDFLCEVIGPAWKPDTESRPKRLLLAAEQGYGDTLMVGQLAVSLHRQGWNLGLWCQPALVSLFRECTNLPWVSDDLPKRGEFDGWLPLLSLPKLLDIGIKPAPLASGYLKVPSCHINHWHAKLRRDEQKKLIALHWQGNPVSETSLYSRSRSILLQQLKPLTKLSNVQFISIQKGYGSEQWPGPFDSQLLPTQSLVSESSSFLDTAAILQNCDLLISADSAVVHLAGAIGKPCWVMLKTIPEWRWGIEGSRSYWFDKLKLFRKGLDEEWLDVAARMKGELKKG